MEEPTDADDWRSALWGLLLVAAVVVFVLDRVNQPEPDAGRPERLSVLPGPAASIPRGDLEYFLDPELYGSSNYRGYDYECADIGHRVYVDAWDDPHGLDADGDGVGCEEWGP